MKKNDAAPPMNQHRLAVYARVSTQEQAGRGMSIETQLDTLRRFAEFKGYQIVGEYGDGGYTGGSDNRPRFRAMLAENNTGTKHP